VTCVGHGLNSSSVELVHKFMVQPKLVELKTELVLAVERVLLIPKLNFCRRPLGGRFACVFLTTQDGVSVFWTLFSVLYHFLGSVEIGFQY